MDSTDPAERMRTASAAGSEDAGIQLIHRVSEATEGHQGRYQQLGVWLPQLRTASAIEQGTARKPACAELRQDPFLGNRDASPEKVSPYLPKHQPLAALN